MIDQWDSHDLISETYNSKRTSRQSHPSLLSSVQARRCWCLEIIVNLTIIRSLERPDSTPNVGPVVPVKCWHV